jgi:6-phosphogluconolactonase (cycloisomerase 2 family)
MNHSKRLVLWGLAFLMLAALALPGSLRAQGNFVYTNDDIHVSGGNTVSGFSVAANGALTLLSGSPFSTKGTGSAGGFYASNRTTVSTVGNFLFASNSGSNDVSVFTVNRKTGALTLVTGSPFATGGNGEGGIAVAATPDGKFLMAANSGSNNITVFSIASSGALTPIAHSPFAALAEPDGIKVSPNGKFLAVAEPYAGQVEMFSIAASGSLTSLGASPARAGEGGTGVDIDCAGRLLYAGEANDTGTVVDGYSISQTGTLTPIHGSPFLEPGVGLNSNVVLLGYGLGWKTLFVSNQASNTITLFKVAFNGSLSLVKGSPFPMKSGANVPCGMTTSQDGRLLYVANGNNKVSVFRVSGWGPPTEVAGSPFPTGQSGYMESLTAFPPRALSLLEVLFDGCPINGYSGWSPSEE